MDSPDTLRRSQCRERRLNKKKSRVTHTVFLGIPAKRIFMIKNILLRYTCVLWLIQRQGHLAADPLLVLENFYRTMSIHSADYAVTKCLLSFCSFARLSVTRRYRVETAKRVIEFLHHLVATPFNCYCTKFYGNIPTGPPPRTGASGVKKIAMFDQYSTSSRTWFKIGPYSYHGTPIGTRTRSIEWWYFQWSWVTPNSHFKVTPLFHTQELYTR